MSMEYTRADDFFESIEKAVAKMRTLDPKIMNHPRNMLTLKKIDQAVWLTADQAEQVTPRE